MRFDRAEPLPAQNKDPESQSPSLQLRWMGTSLFMLETTPAVACVFRQDCSVQHKSKGADHGGCLWTVNLSPIRPLSWTGSEQLHHLPNRRSDASELSIATQGSASRGKVPGLASFLLGKVAVEAAVKKVTSAQSPVRSSTASSPVGAALLLCHLEVKLNSSCSSFTLTGWQLTGLRTVGPEA